MIGRCHLHLDHTDELVPGARRLEVPRQQRHANRRGVRRVHETHAGIRRQFDPQRRVQVPVGSGGPLPHRILGELAPRLPVQHAPADMSPRLRLHQPHRDGVTGAPGFCRRFHQLWLDHPAGDQIWPLERDLAAGD